MGKPAANDLPDPQDMTYEQAIAELEAISARIERGEIGLEESLQAYRRGLALTKRCNSILDAAEQELKQIKPGSAEDSAKGS